MWSVSRRNVSRQMVYVCFRCIYKRSRTANLWICKNISNLLGRFDRKENKDAPFIAELRGCISKTSWRGDQRQSEIDGKETSKSSHLWSFNPETKTIVICSQDGASTTCRVGGGGEGEGQTQWWGEGGGGGEENTGRVSLESIDLNWISILVLGWIYRLSLLKFSFSLNWIQINFTQPINKIAEPL